MSAFPAGRPISQSGFFTAPWRMFLLGIYNKTGGASGITYASSITNVPAGHITATDVQAALNQLDTIKGTVNSFTFTDANGITGSVLNPTTTPSLTLALGAITPTSVAAAGSVTGSNLSGTNTGDQFTSTTASVLLGRGTASGAGAAQEVTLGSGVSMVGTVLSATGLGGSVTSVSVVSANGFAGTVATASTTPAITLTTTITGLLKGNGTAISASVVTDDVQTKAAIVPNTAPAAGGLLVGNAGATAYAPVAASGAVTLASTGAFSLATPGTLTVSTTNTGGTGAHVHTITSSSTPGAAASLLATDASGNIGATGSRIVRIWAIDLTCTNNIAGSITGNAATVTTNANLTGDVTSVGNATTLTNAPVIAKVLTGYTSGAGTVAATDSILQAIQKLNGNDATNANLTGVITSVGNATSIASQTGTGTKFVVDTSPALVTPAIGVATGTSLAVSGLLTSSSPSAGVGYAAGAGAALSQGAGSGKATGISSNVLTAQVTMNNASLAANTTVTHTVTNTSVGIKDTVQINIVTTVSTANYNIWAGVAAGSFNVNLRNITAGALAEALVYNYTVIKGQNS